jgi:hypothetical protein
MKKKNGRERGRVRRKENKNILKMREGECERGTQGE